jgi:hypothetical protein
MTKAATHRGKKPYRQPQAPRDDLDFYIENKWCSEILLKLPIFKGITDIYDPCCGSGNIVDSADELGFEAFGDDLSPDRCSPDTGPADFFNLTNAQFSRSFQGRATAIVSNPPYGRAETAERFIRHALTFLDCPLIAVFVEVRFLFSGKRHSFFAHEHPPTCIAFLSSRPSCPPGDAFLRGEIKATGGTQQYVWLIYDRRLGPAVCPPHVWLKRDDT